MSSDTKRRLEGALLTLFIIYCAFNVFFLIYTPPFDCHGMDRGKVVKTMRLCVDLFACAWNKF